MAGHRTAEGGVKPEVKVAAGLGLLAITCGVISLLSPDANQHDGQPVPGSGDAGPTTSELTPFAPAWLGVGDSCETAPMAVFPVSGVNVGVLCDRETLNQAIVNLDRDVVVIDPRPVIDLSSEGWQEIPGIERLIPVIEEAGVFVNPDGGVRIGVFSHTYFEDGQIKLGFGLLFPSVGLPDTLTMVDLPEGLLKNPSLCAPIEAGEYQCGLPVVGYNHNVAAGLVPVEAEGTPLVVKGVILKVDENGVLQTVGFDKEEYEIGGGHLVAPVPVFSLSDVPTQAPGTETSTPALTTPRSGADSLGELSTELASDRRATPEPPPEKPTAVVLPPTVPPTAVVAPPPEAQPPPAEILPTPEQPMSPELQELVTLGWPPTTQIEDGRAHVVVDRPLPIGSPIGAIAISDCRNPTPRGGCLFVKELNDLEFESVEQAWQAVIKYLQDRGEEARLTIAYVGDMNWPANDHVVAVAIGIHSP